MNIILEDECCAFFCEIGEEDVYSDVCTKYEKKLWDNGTVPYKFDGNVSLKLQIIVKEAMKRITEVSSIVFEERKDQKDYIKIVDEGKFWSWVGKKGGRQLLSVTSKRDYPIGRTMHELMHALGFHHEHCRPDRDEYVNINAKINKENDKNYKIFAESEVLKFGPYYFESIMHYSRFQGVEPKLGTNAEIGQREKLSDGDIMALKNLYPYMGVICSQNMTPISFVALRVGDNCRKIGIQCRNK